MSSFSPVYLDTDLALEHIGDIDSMNNMLQMLHEYLSRDIGQISQCLRDGDGVAANQLLHALKGFMPIFCRDDFCQRVVAVELLSKQLDCAATAPAYAALRPELEQLQADVAAYLRLGGVQI